MYTCGVLSRYFSHAVVLSPDSCDRLLLLRLCLLLLRLCLLRLCLLRSSSALVVVSPAVIFCSCGCVSCGHLLLLRLCLLRLCLLRSSSAPAVMSPVAVGETKQNQLTTNYWIKYIIMYLHTGEGQRSLP